MAVAETQPPVPSQALLDPASPLRDTELVPGAASADAPPPSLPLEELRELTDIEDIHRQLRLLNFEETQVDADLDALLQHRGNLEKELQSLELLRPQIGILKNDASTLLNSISGTSQLAEKISDKVRQLDLEQSRVKATIKLVEDIQELKNCANGAQQALRAKDYESAAQHIHRYLRFDPQVIENIFAGDAGDTLYFIDTTSPPTEIDHLNGASPLQALRDARQGLTDVAIDQFDHAVQAGDEDAIVRFFKLFPLIGQHEIGLDKFSAYICGIISRQCQNGMRGASDQVQSFYAGLLTRLFETIAMVVDRQEPMVETTYGPGRMLRIIQRLQREADIQSSIIMDAFSEKRQLQRKLYDINLYEARRPPGAAKPEITLDPRELAVILGEIAIMSQRAQLFDRFLHIRAEENMEKLHNAKSETPSESTSGLDGEGDGLVKVSKLNERMQELMGKFVAMEEFWIRKSLEKAVNLEEYDPNSRMSSSVDDVFYLLRQSIARSLSTSDPDCVCAVINSIGRILEVDYISVFQKRLAAAFSATDGRDPKMSFVPPLNNIDISCDYILKLTQQLESDIPRAFNTASEISLEKMKSCVDTFNEYSGSFRNMVKTWLENLFNQTIKPRLKPVLQQAYGDLKYVLSEDEYAEQDSTVLFVKRFINGFTTIVEPYQKVYTETNYNQTIVLTIDQVAKDWERHILANQRFNQFGALRFDKDLRAITSHLTGLIPWTTRDKFTRLHQISTLLNVESLSEVNDCINAKGGPVAWRLTVAEVRKVLALRTDFTPEEITRLKLA
ncbi:Golgi transport complex subunit 4 [Rhizophlyctis rosea]|nr:Golgi transport complex subunit 4 [Rhizophlyctis rosea]